MRCQGQQLPCTPSLDCPLTDSVTTFITKFQSMVIGLNGQLGRHALSYARAAPTTATGPVTPHCPSTMGRTAPVPVTRRTPATLTNAPVGITELGSTWYSTLNIFHPYIVHGGWATWDSWTACTVTCGSSGTVDRTRTCTDPAPQFEGNSCSQEEAGAEQTIACPNSSQCPSKLMKKHGYSSSTL